MSNEFVTERPTDLPWQDTGLAPAQRLDALIEAMTLREKVAQLYGIWVGAASDGGEVAPFQHDLDDAVDLDEVLPHGLGQLTRPFGSAPVDPASGIVSLARTQQRIMRTGRLGIPAIAHEECLAGLTAWGATAYPTPPVWGASFDPELIERLGARIGATLRSLGIHQGLAPVLDVVRDPRWGRVEETIGEDPYLVGTIGAAYVRGLESTGVIATLKHFVGYSASRAARNLAPVSIGARELAEVLLVPFEMAIALTGVRSVMPAYVDIDGVPASADPELLTHLLRERWGFGGTVVSDYYSIAFLATQHRIAGDFAGAGAAALRAGLDVELPNMKAYGDQLAAEVQAGRLDEAIVDRALRRVLAQKLELGMLDADFSPLPVGVREGDLADVAAIRGTVDLDRPEDRALAREVAEQGVVLLANDGVLPLTDTLAAGARVLVTGPRADDPLAMLGCYSFPAHVGMLHPEVPLGIEIPTALDGLRAELPEAVIEHGSGIEVDGEDASAIPGLARAASDADLVVLYLGDRAGLFGRGTSGEGCDAATMRLPGRQSELLEAMLDSGTPVVVVLLEGRPYALGTAPERAAAIVVGFLPGEEGAHAVAGVLSGRVAPSGRLPFSVPRHAGGQPSSYLASSFAGRSDTSNLDPTPAYPFGHGLGYADCEWSQLEVDGRPVDGDSPMALATDGTLTVSLTVTNSGPRDDADVVQLYLEDPVASVVRPRRRLIGFAKLQLAAGTRRRVHLAVSAELAAFVGRDGGWMVEPGPIRLVLGASSEAERLAVDVELTGDARPLDHTRCLQCAVTIEDAVIADPAAAGTEAGR